MTRPRILIVEGETLIAEALQRRVTRMGMVVVGVTRSGEEAVALAGSGAPDLVLMDIRLKGALDGISAATAIRDRFNVPVVFVTAHSDPTTVARASEAAPLGYLINPFGERDLEVAIEMVLHKRATDRMAHKLVVSRRMEHLGRLAQGIAADLDAALAPIIGNAQCAARHAASGSQLERQLDTIRGAAERAAALCRQMRAYADGGNIEVVRVDVDGLIESIEALLHGAIAGRARLVLDLDPDVGQIEVDRLQMQQLLMNLTINAAEAVQNNGLIVIRCRSMRLDPGEIAAVPGGGAMVAIAVSDNGIGMDEETQRRAFEPFFTRKSVGRGLGLTAAQAIARAHCGALTVTSTPSQGATFCLYLPAAGPEPEAPVIDADHPGDGARRAE